MAETPTQKPRRGRSPNYPGTSLGECIDRARQLYKAETKHPTPVVTILGHWGYKPKSGPGWSLLASLKNFNLLVDQGSGQDRKARLTDEALAIIQDEREDSTDRIRAIQEAALRPNLHRKLWDEYQGTLPSDGNLRFSLLREHHFTESGAAQFIRQFKSTLDFAGLLNGGMLTPEDEDNGGAEGEELMESGTTTFEKPPGKETLPAQTKVIQLPIAPKEWAALQAPFPLTEDKWTQMLAVLNAMKPALVSEERNTDERSSDNGAEGSDS